MERRGREEHRELLAPHHCAAIRRKIGTGRYLIVERAVRCTQFAEVEATLRVAISGGGQIDEQIRAVAD